MICPNPQCKQNVSVLMNTCPSCGMDLTNPYLETTFHDASRPIWVADGRTNMGQGILKKAGARDVEVEVEHWDKLNWSLINYGIPMINRLSISNISLSPIENLLVRVELATGYGDSWERSIPVIPPKKTFVAERINIPLSRDKLRSVTESEQAFLKTEISSNGNNLFKETRPVEVLAYNEWYFHPLLTDSLAGFILPNCEAVTETIKYAGEYLKKVTESASFDGYQSKSHSKVESMAQALYLALQKGLKIKYINPPASFEPTGQKILFPEGIMYLSRGTCLDLALFYAACIERIGCYPLIFLVPGHALLGLWLSQKDYENYWKNEAALEERHMQKPARDAKEAFVRYFHHLQERYERVKKAITDGGIIPLNSTTFTKEEAFSQCKAEGLAICRQVPFDAVIDVKKARQDVKPMVV